MDDIEAVQNNYQGKMGHLNLKLKNGKDCHVKHDKTDIMDKWVAAITKVYTVYKGKKLFEFEFERVYKEKVDQRISNMIFEDLESEPDLTQRSIGKI